MREEINRRKHLESAPLEGLDPRKLIERVLQTSAGLEKKAWQPLLPKEVEAILDGYEVKSLIGRGGMGAVYQVYHKALQRVRALKLLPLSVSERPDFEERFLREARAMANLDHPNIVHIYDFGHSSLGHLFYVMEYVGGADLSCLIREGGVSYRETLSIVSQVAGALSYAHAKGYVHRDVKPNNVLLNAEGRVKVVDFGVAKIIHDEGYDPTMTLQGEVLGTLGYMSPEQTVGGSVDHRSDIYSLGVMLYEMLTGALPQGNFVLPSKKSSVDERLDAVVMQALQQDPQRRYQRAEELKEAIDKCAGMGSVNSRGMIVALSLAALGALVVLLLSGPQYFQTQGRADTQPPVRSDAEVGYQNSLGMQLLPVRGTKVLFSQSETRWSEWDRFLNATRHPWEAPAFNYPANHAALNVSWNDAQKFCEWLTEVERNEGRIDATMRYRLPTDSEWSAAVGLKEEEGATPEQRSKLNTTMYGWGAQWPAPDTVTAGIDQLDSEAFGITKALRDSHRLMSSPMNTQKIQQFKNQTYWIKGQSWTPKLRGEMSDFMYLPEHAGRVMQVATDQIQFRHWDGKTVVLIGRWMARHAEVALPMVGWQSVDWMDAEFREFFQAQDWGFESGMSLFAPAHWDNVKGRWMLAETTIDLDLFASPEYRSRAHHLRIELLEGDLKFHHDNRQKVCYPVVLFDGVLGKDELRAQVEIAYSKLQAEWYRQAAKVCTDLLPRYEAEWLSHSQPVDSLMQNKFGIIGAVGGAKEWVTDAYSAADSSVKTLRGGAMRLRGRGPFQLDKTASDREVVEAVVAYACPPEEELSLSHRDAEQADKRLPWHGFRVVLEQP